MARFTAFMALVGGLVFVGAEPAAAATVVGGTQPLIVTGGHGVVNSISVTESGNELLVSDAGDVITPGDGCAAISAHSVRCPADVKEVQVNAGDRRDVVTINVTSVSTTVDAGTGADHVTVTTSYGSLVDGGPGNDTLTVGDLDGALVTLSGGR